MSSSPSSSRIRAMFIAPRPPLPATDGGTIRSSQILKALAARYDIDLAAYLPPEYDLSKLDQTRRYCREVRTVPLPAGFANRPVNAARSVCSLQPVNYLRYHIRPMRDALRALSAESRYDVIFFCNAHTTAHVDLFARGGFKILDTQNNDASIMRRWAERRRNPALQAFAFWQARLIERYLRAVLPRMDLTLTVSEKEEAELRAFAPGARFLTVENGVDLDYFAYSENGMDTPREAERLLYTGDMCWMPNVDACDYFMREILPLVRAERPQARLTLGGRKPPPALLEIAARAGGVEATGYVEDLRPHFRRATAFVVPLRIGGGTRLKILEAMAMKIPVISTSRGCEGLAVRDGEHLLIRDDPASFARAVLDLLDDSALRARLSRNARAFVETSHAWSIVLRKLLDALPMDK